METMSKAIEVIKIHLTLLEKTHKERKSTDDEFILGARLGAEMETANIIEMLENLEEESMDKMFNDLREESK